jgi:hypothetical protein
MKAIVIGAGTGELTTAIALARIVNRSFFLSEMVNLKEKLARQMRNTLMRLSPSFVLHSQFGKVYTLDF